MNEQYFKMLPHTTHKLSSGGVFLTSGLDTPSTMTIGWAFMGYSWRKPVFVAMVRPSRHTYALLSEHPEFTVSIPSDESPLSDALRLCGTLSGRDTDKWAAAGLSRQAARTVSVPVVGECASHIECRLINTDLLGVASMDEVLVNASYPNDDVHVLFYGEVVACY